MQIRASIIQEIINEEVVNFKSINQRMKIYIDESLYQNIIVQNEIITRCLNELQFELIDKWNGIVLKQTKHKFESYRKYFTTSRSWFDQRKKNILANNLWLPTFDLIQKFTKTAAKQYFNERFINLQHKFQQSLTAQVIDIDFSQYIKSLLFFDAAYALYLSLIPLFLPNHLLTIL